METKGGSKKKWNALNKVNITCLFAKAFVIDNIPMTPHDKW